jgi:hypothetical protein
MNSVGGHVVAKLRPDPRIVHEVERTGRTPSLSRWLLRELALVGVTARPPTRWDQVLLCAQARSQTSGVAAIVLHRLHPGTAGR